MFQMAVNPGYTSVLLFCLISYQTLITNALLTKLVDGLASTISQLTTVRAMTDAATNLEGKVLQSVTGIENASSYTNFLFYSRESRENSTMLKVGDLETCHKSGFSEIKHTKILIHGWVQNGTDRFSTTMTDAFLNAEDLNIISVSWPGYSQNLYSVAYNAVPYVGSYTASLVDFLVKDVGVDISTVHVIGFSLGAHIAGVVGESVTSGKVTRITGIDPAGPLFTSSSTKGRLDASDAKFVDVIHTTAGTVGFADPCGSVDFYPNGGYIPQPGTLVIQPFQSHFRAYLLYAESITSEGFIATQCNSWNSFEKGECADNETTIMGYHVDTRSKGVFYLNTNPESPYAQHCNATSIVDQPSAS